MLPTGLSMLWEPVDADAALHERFGFTGLGPVGDWVREVLAGTWDVTPGSLDRVVISDQNAIVWVSSDRGPLVVKWSRAQERFGRLDASARVLGMLADHGLPVAAPLPAVDGRLRVVLDGPFEPLSVAVLPELAGDWLDVADEPAVRSAGATLARLHEALRDCHDDRLAPTPGIQDPRLQIQRWLSEHDPGFVPQASSRLRDLLSGLPELPGAPQLLHNDFRAANLLVRDSSVVGVLDLDDMVLGHRVGDLARSAVYLATRFTDWGPTPVAAQRALRAGYEAVRPLGAVEGRWFDVLLLWHAIMAIPGEDDPTGWAGAV